MNPSHQGALLQPIHESSSSVGRLARAGVSFAGDIARAAERHGIDARLLAAVAAQETGGPGANHGRNIVGGGGHGRGIFQIDDRWHSFARTPAAMNPAQNADYAAGIIAGLLRRFAGDVHKTLSAYNAGSGNATGTMTTWADGRRLGYADSVLRHYGELGGRSTAASLTGADQAESAQAKLCPKLVQEIISERASEGQSVNELQNFALQAPVPSEKDHTYRTMAGLDDQAHSRDTKTTQFLDSIVGDGDAAETSFTQGA